VAKFDPKRLSRMDWIIVGAAGLALISLFLPWYGASTSATTLGISVSSSVSGFSTGYGWIGGLLIVAAGVYLVLQRSQADLSSIKAGPATVVMGASVIGTVMVLLRWISLPRGHGGIGGLTSYSYGPRVGLVLTLIVGIVQAVSALSLFRASGEKLPWSQ